MNPLATRTLGLTVAVCLLAPALALSQPDFTVTVQVKTQNHPYFGQGDPHGYAINGVEGMELTLERGQTYVFQMSNVPVDHPFYISTSSVGAGAGIWNDGVDGNFASGSSTLTFTVPQSAPDELWYQCAAHLYMGYRINIVDGAQPDEFLATLSSAQEIPANPSRASGLVEAVLTGNTLVVTGSFEGLSGPYTASHLHLGYAGQNGPVELTLTADLGAGQTSGTYAAANNTFELTGAQLAALQQQRMYVNVHSTVYPPGEIRGQVLPAGLPTFYAVPTGRAEIPANASQGRGAAIIQVAEDGVTLSGAFSDLGTDYTASHIHVAPVHQNGPVVFDLTPVLDPGMRSGTYSVSENTFAVTSTHIEDLVNNRWYLNVHTQEFPPGEIRGQFFLIGTRTFEIRMIGEHETPPVASSGSGGAIAQLHASTLRVGGAFAGLGSNYTASHIHVGDVSEAGPVVFGLTTDVGGDGASGTWAMSENAFTLDAGQLDALFAGDYYINVHSVDNPPGEIRGQLLPTTNLAPGQATITNPADGSSIVIEGDPTKFLTIEWQGSDPNNNPLGFRWQLASDAAFDNIVFGHPTVMTTSLDLSYGEIDAVLASLGVPVGQSVQVHHRAVATDGGFLTPGEGASVTITRGEVIDTEPGAEPIAFAVRGPAPNPVESTTVLYIDLPVAADVVLQVYDLLGRRVLEDQVGPLGAGTNHAVSIDAAGLAGGVYIYRIEAVAADQTHVATGRVVRVP